MKPLNETLVEHPFLSNFKGFWVDFVFPNKSVGTSSIGIGRTAIDEPLLPLAACFAQHVIGS